MYWPTGSGAVAMALLSLTLTSWPAARAVETSRVRRLSPAMSPAPTSGPGTASAIGTAEVHADQHRAGVAVRRRAMIFSGIAGAAVLSAVPSVVGALSAVAVSAGTYLLLRGPSLIGEPRSRAARWLGRVRWSGANSGRISGADPALPFAIDLLAVCLRGGMPTSAALRAVADILSVDIRPAHSAWPARGAHPARRAPAVSGGPEVSAVMARVAAASELGSEPATAWAEWIGHPIYGPLARALVVTGESGSAVAGRLEAVSQRMRTASGQQAVSRAQRAGVALMAPLGLCFLPAFVCLGVVPVVVGIASRVLG